MGRATFLINLGLCFKSAIMTLVFLSIDFRERGEGGREGGGEREREKRKRDRDIDLSLHVFIHSLVVPCMCPDWESNPQPWSICALL